MSPERHQILPVWFFAGILLLIYGCIILVSGLAEWSTPPATALASLHAPVWWGGLMTAVGLVYTLTYRPRRR